MSRVNVEEEFFGQSRLSRFETLMGWDRRTAVGCLVLLWHDSQAQLATEGTEEQIKDWAWCFTDDDRAKLVPALVKAGYIHRLDNGLYSIHGNEKQIDNLVQRTSSAHKGGVANKERWAAIKAAKAPQEAVRLSEPKPDASRTASLYDSHTAIPEHASRLAKPEPNDRSMQCSAMQCKENISPPKSDPPLHLSSDRPAEPPSKATPFDLDLAGRWAAYAQTVLPRIKPKPDRWADTIRLLRTKDGLTEDELEQVFAFVQQDEFWRVNAISPEGLRGKSKSNGLRKIENIMRSMGSRKPPPKQKTRIIEKLEDLDELV